MSKIPKMPDKIKALIKQINSGLKQERKIYGGYHDSGGQRYWLGPLHLLLGDVKGAVKSFAWFEKTFPDDIGDPTQYLCWSLALYKNGDFDAAEKKLRQTMLQNLYLLPHLFGTKLEELDVDFTTNLEDGRYLKYIPQEILALWDEDARKWALACYESPAFVEWRTCYIDLNRELKNEPVGPRRTALVNELHSFR